MNSDQLPVPYVWEPDPAFDMLGTPNAPESQEATEAVNHPQPTTTDKALSTESAPVAPVEPKS